MAVWYTIKGNIITRWIGFWPLSTNPGSWHAQRPQIREPAWRIDAKKNAPKFFPDRPSGVKISVARVHFFSKPLSMHTDKENTVSDAVLNKNLLLKARFFFVSKSTRFDWKKSNISKKNKLTISEAQVDLKLWEAEDTLRCLSRRQAHSNPELEASILYWCFH